MLLAAKLANMLGDVKHAAQNLNLGEDKKCASYPVVMLVTSHLWGG